MYTVFDEKKYKLLSILKTLALKHNRDYYISLIPIVESATFEQEDILDMYQQAFDENAHQLLQSRQAMKTVQRINSYL